MLSCETRIASFHFSAFNRDDLGARVSFEIKREVSPHEVKDRPLQ